MNWLRRLWDWLDEPEAPVAAPPARAITISDSALFEAGRGDPLQFSVEQTFGRAQPFASVAMDQLPSVTPLVNYAIQQRYHEGIGFLGYALLAELAQRPEYRRASEIRAEHATRKWIELKGPEEKTKAIADEFKRLKVKEMFRLGLEKDGFFGRCQLFMDFGDADDPNELEASLPIDERKISPKRPLQQLKLVEPMWSYPGLYGSSNPLAQDFYKPNGWYVYGYTVHDSRMLTFVGNEVPDMLKPAYAFGGLSLSQMLKPYVDNWLRTRQSVSDMVNSFSQDVLKTNMQGVLQGGSGDDLWKRLSLYTQMKSNRGIKAIDKETEEFENIATPLSGLKDLQEQALELICAISGIPRILYIGVKPSGLSSNSEEELETFYTDIRSNEQEGTCDPLLKRLLNVVQLSLFGKIDPAITYEWVPLWEMSEEQAATVRKTDAETDGAYIAAGVVSNEEVRERLANEEGGRYFGLKGPAPEPEEEDEDDAE